MRDRRLAALGGVIPSLTGTCLLATGLLSIAATPGPAAASSLVRQSGVVYAWGDNDAGQLGVGTITVKGINHDSLVPLAVHMPPGVQAISIAGGESHSLAVTRAGTIYAWGYNGLGQLGTGNTTATTSPVEVLMPVGVFATQVAAGYKHSYALTSDGVVYAWGSNDDGELGGPRPGVAQSDWPVPVLLPAGVKAAEIAAGCDSGFAVTRTGAVYGWGLNEAGQLGDGTTVDRYAPVRMLLPRGVTAVSVSSAAAHSLVLTSTGAVYAVGDNTYGELGTGTDASSTVPVPVVFPAGTVIVAVSAGDGSGLGLAGGYSLALSSTGVVYAWGDNESGDLGDGSNTNSDLPAVVQVPDGVVPTSVVAGGNRAHLLSSAGQVYDWGTDEKGTHIHLTPLLDPQAPDGATPLLIASGPDAEQYLALMAPTAAS